MICVVFFCRKKEAIPLKKLLCTMGSLLLSLLLLSLLTFCASRLAPGDPLYAYYGDRAERFSAEERLSAHAALGLDRPLPIQYLHWLGQAAEGEFGLSLKYKRPAIEVIGAVWKNTLLLGGLSLVCACVLAIPLAVLCCLREGRFADRLCRRLGGLLGCIPAFWLSLLLILLFSVRLGWLPASGAHPLGMDSFAGRLRHLILPLAVMVVGHLWYFAGSLRTRLLEESRRGYVLLCRARGYSRARILWRHCLRCCMPGYLGLCALSLPHLLGGTYLVEQVFGYPGIGSLCFESAKYHDYNLLMLLALLTGAMVMLGAGVARMLGTRIDPRAGEGDGR